MHRFDEDRGYGRLHERFGTAGRLTAARNTLFWDSQTCMPPGGAWSRGEQLAALDAMRIDLLTAPDMAELFALADRRAHALSAVERANLAEMRRLWRHSAAVPKALMLEKTRQTAALQGMWLAAKQANDFKSFAAGFAPLLGLICEIAQAKVEAFGLAPYDTLLDEFDPGLTTAIIDPILDDLETALPPLLGEVLERQAAWPQPAAFESVSADRQRALCCRLMAAVGHDPRHARIDVAPHPFTLAGAPGDTRITTRFAPDNVRFAVMATLHEAGHALYEANLPRAHAFAPVGQPRGLTVHESQSLMLEMQASRSREFVRWLAPQMAEACGGDPAGWSFPNLLDSQRRVGRGFIRVEADEVSYPLHIILRYQIERALLSGELQVDDIPEAWAEISEALIGCRPPDHARGSLQDPHWAAGLFGYFPNYALGACLAAQLFERAVQDDPAVQTSLADGDFGPYRAWVVPRIHQKASELSFADLVQEATGAPLSAAALERHLRRRYLEEPAP